MLSEKSGKDLPSTEREHAVQDPGRESNQPLTVNSFTGNLSGSRKKQRPEASIAMSDSRQPGEPLPETDGQVGRGFSFGLVRNEFSKIRF